VEQFSHAGTTPFGYTELGKDLGYTGDSHMDDNILVNTILPKMGVNKNTASNMVFGTSNYRGIGLDHLFAVQGFAKIQYLIGSLRTQDTMVDLYQMLLEYSQL
jgi:hypothetical protein